MCRAVVITVMKLRVILNEDNFSARLSGKALFREVN